MGALAVSIHFLRRRQSPDVAVVSDATAAAQHPELGDGYAAARTNFRYISGAVLTPGETVKAFAA